MAQIRIPPTVAQPLQQAIDMRMSLDAWRKRELAKGIADGDAPEPVFRALVLVAVERGRRTREFDHRARRTARNRLHS